AAQDSGPARVPGVVGECLSPRVIGRARRNAGAHAHVLLGIRRHHRCSSANGRGCTLDRDIAFGYDSARHIRSRELPEWNWAGGIRRALTRGSRGCRDREAAQQGAHRAHAGSTLGKSRLWSQDTPVGGSPPQHERNSSGRNACSTVAAARRLTSDYLTSADNPPRSATSFAIPSAVAPFSRYPSSTPTRSASGRFWLIFHLPSILVIGISTPTIPFICAMMKSAGASSTFHGIR